MKDGLLLLAGIFVALVIAFLGYGCVQSNTPEGKERASERHMIDRCWEAVNDELSSLETRRFMRAGCRQMEQSFREKWDRDP